MRRRILPAVALVSCIAAALTVAAPLSAAQVGTWSASKAGTRQRVMLVQKHRFGDREGQFELVVLSLGPIRSDTGSFTLAAELRPSIVRQGQGLSVYVVIETLTGAQGTFDVRWRVEFAGAGEGNTVGTGTWRILRGTGAYAGVTGG